MSYYAHAKTRTLNRSVLLLIDPRERREQFVHVLFLHSDPRIIYLKRKNYVLVVLFAVSDVKSHMAFVCVLGGIRQKIERHLFDPYLITIENMRNIPVDTQIEPEPLLFGTGSCHVDKIVYDGGQVILRWYYLHPSFFDLGKIKYVIDQRQERPARSLDIPCIRANVLLPAFPDYHLIHSENGIYRSPDLMGHIGQERRFGAVGLIGHPLLFLELFHVHIMLCIINNRVDPSRTDSAVGKSICLGSVYPVPDPDRLFHVNCRSYRIHHGARVAYQLREHRNRRLIRITDLSGIIHGNDRFGQSVDNIVPCKGSRIEKIVFKYRDKHKHCRNGEAEHRHVIQVIIRERLKYADHEKAAHCGHCQHYHQISLLRDLILLPAVVYEQDRQRIKSVQNVYRRPDVMIPAIGVCQEWEIVPNLECGDLIIQIGPVCGDHNKICDHIKQSHKKPCHIRDLYPGKFHDKHKQRKRNPYPSGI